MSFTSPKPAPPRLERKAEAFTSKRFVTTGTRTVKSRSRWKPHVKWKSPSWEKVGRAVAGILPVEAANMPRVEKTELYETKAPPGKSGGGVFRAAPWATSRPAQVTRNATTDPPQTSHRETMLIPS